MQQINDSEETKIRNKKVWRSPFAFRQGVEQVRNKNLQKSRFQNLEKSLNVANVNSIYFNQSEKNNKKFNQWSYKELYKKQNELKRDEMLQIAKQMQIQKAQNLLYINQQYQNEEDDIQSNPNDLNATRNNLSDLNSQENISPDRIKYN